MVRAKEDDNTFDRLPGPTQTRFQQSTSVPNFLAVTVTVAKETRTEIIENFLIISGKEYSFAVWPQKQKIQIQLLNKNIFLSLSSILTPSLSPFITRFLFLYLSSLSLCKN